jgi:hypothetical protein
MNPKKDKLRTLLIWSIIIVVACWIIIPLIIFGVFGKPDGPGTFGDSFGVVNALFSALAFSLLIYTSLMQREELELQRKELELTRQEVKKSAEAQATLVNLTREQLDLEKAIRRNEVKPELVLMKNIWVTRFDNSSYLEITIGVSYYKLVLSGVELSSQKEIYELNESELKERIEKYFSPGDSFIVLLEPADKNPRKLDGLRLQFEFRDVDGRHYSQSLTFGNETHNFANVKEKDWGTDI